MKRTKQTNITPLTAIRRFCKECVGGNTTEIETCSVKGECVFFPYRNGKGRPSIQLIRKKCVECMGNDRNAITECSMITCPLYPYRFGTNPARKGIGRGNNNE